MPLDLITSRDMNPDNRLKTVSKLLADSYSQKILTTTYSTAMSAQRISKVCRIPIAACYRRIHDLETVGLLGVENEQQVAKGRTVRLYKCRLKSAAIEFTEGEFAMDFDTADDGAEE
jgi:predicted ArsR family transcriptional regulator